MQFDLFGPTKRLRAAIRGGTWQVAVQDDRDYQYAGPWLFGWDRTSYIWCNGFDRGISLGAKPPRS